MTRTSRRMNISVLVLLAWSFGVWFSLSPSSIRSSFFKLITKEKVVAFWIRLKFSFRTPPRWNICSLCFTNEEVHSIEATHKRSDQYCFNLSSISIDWWGQGLLFGKREIRLFRWWSIDSSSVCSLCCRRFSTECSKSSSLDCTNYCSDFNSSIRRSTMGHIDHRQHIRSDHVYLV